MRLTTRLFFAAVFMVALVSPAPVKRHGHVDTSLIPEFGIEPGKNPDSHGYCDGALDANGVPARIPPGCPPNRAAFVQAVTQYGDPGWFGGKAYNNRGGTFPFPNGNSTEHQMLRLTSLLEILGEKFNCPSESTTWEAQKAALYAASKGGGH
ncbi:hypothetical protein BC835DRAFT_606874 [Cytidiella melzeri]|nr:hypothetical protein BC835DRAFT_606874 [Cytidiella melzeri]